MSTLNVTNISDGTNSTSTTNVVQGSAKAWVNFDGDGTAEIRADYNISSLEDNGTGSYAVNFTTAFSDANYAAPSCVGGSNGVTDLSSQTASRHAIFTRSLGGSQQDQRDVHIAFFR